MLYLLDANVFIQAKNFYYAYDICPGFWEWLDQTQGAGTLASIAPVGQELIRGNDDLGDWAKQRQDGTWFLDVQDTDTQKRYSDISANVAGSGCTEPAIATFLGGADPWLIAKAMTIGATVVTHERYRPDARSRVLIPNVCADFDVPYLDTFELLRQLSASFVLNTDKAA